MIGAILMAIGAALAWVYILSMPEEVPEKKTASTGVVEQALTSEGVTRYVIRFTGDKNRSYLAKTPGYTGQTDKYQDGKLVHIRYWFGKKTTGAEILDDALTPVPARKSPRFLLFASALIWIAGIVLVVI